MAYKNYRREFLKKFPISLGSYFATIIDVKKFDVIHKNDAFIRTINVHF